MMPKGATIPIPRSLGAGQIRLAVSRASIFKATDFVPTRPIELAAVLTRSAPSLAIARHRSPLLPVRIPSCAGVLRRRLDRSAAEIERGPERGASQSRDCLEWDRVARKRSSACASGMQVYGVLHDQHTHAFRMGL